MASVNPTYEEEAEHREDEDWWGRQMMNFAKKARDGVWYTFDEFIRHYGVKKHPGTREVPGDARTIKMLKERIRGLKKQLQGFHVADRARQSISVVLYELQELLNENLALAKKRRDYVMPKWNESSGLTQEQSSKLNKIIWAWKRWTDLDERDLKDEEQDAEWPYHEDCYPIGNEWEHWFYTEDQWHPPLENSTHPRTIKGTEGRTCLYRKAFSLDLCPPDFFLKVKDMARWRLYFSRQRFESKGKGKGKKGDDSSSDEEMTDAQRSEKDEQRKGKGKGKSRRIRAPTKVVEHIKDEDRDRMLQSIRDDLLELFK